MAMKLQMKQERRKNHNLGINESCVMTVYLSEEMYEKIKQMAYIEKTTISYQTKIIIMKFVDEYDPFCTSLEVKTGEELKNLRFGVRKRFGININRYYNDRLKEIAYQNKTSVAEIIRALLDENIALYEKMQKEKENHFVHSLAKEKPFEMYIDLA